MNTDGLVIIQQNNDRYFIRNAEGKQMCEYIPDIETAQLISAAPEMYEALKELIDNTLFENNPPPLITWQLWRKKAVKALAKAEGVNK